MMTQIERENWRDVPIEPKMVSATDTSILQEFSCSIAKITNWTSLRHLILSVLKEKRLVNEYFIWFNGDASGTPGYIYDERTKFAVEPEFIELLTQLPVLGGELDTWEGAFSSERYWDVRLAMQKGGVTPWIFFLNRIGIAEITGIRLAYGERNLGVLWFEPRIADANLFKAIASLISVAIANILALKVIDQQTAEIAAHKELIHQDVGGIKDGVGKCDRSNIIGSGPLLQKVFELMNKVSGSYATVLITGETGTGKELVASGIHHCSTRKDQPFIKVNCAALPPNLIESELFGHEKGSFTGAIERRIGKFELANNGTLFLDEIGEMPPELQVKLLRAIQEKEIERVGGSKTIRVNVRLIAATNRNLQLEVEQGRFRSDLYYRLNVFPIEIPALRNRKEDIPELVQYFIDRYAKRSFKQVSSIANSALKRMMHYHWPGNVRELEHLIERSILLAKGSILQDVYLPVVASHKGDEGQDISIRTLAEVERDHIIKVLNQCAGKISGKAGAAIQLGVPATTLSAKIARLKIAKKQLYE